MPVLLIVLSVLGAVFFGFQWLSEPAGWPRYALGLAACIFLGVRNLTVMRSNQRVQAAPVLREVLTRATLDEALGSPRAILYKHSTSCPVSAEVVDEVLRFASRHPDWRIYLLKVLEHRELSDATAERLGVPHESPQAFVIRDGHAVWSASHYGITAQNLGRNLAEVRSRR